MSRRYPLLLALLASACAAGSMRPPFAPLANAKALEVSATPAQVITTVRSELLKEQGMQMQWDSPQDGYLETQWYNVESRSSGNFSTASLDRVVLFRFWADPGAPGKTKVTAEAVWLRGYDPSRSQREQESMVPDAHLGGRLLDRVMQRLRTDYGA